MKRVSAGALNSHPAGGATSAPAAYGRVRHIAHAQGFKDCLSFLSWNDAAISMTHIPECLFAAKYSPCQSGKKHQSEQPPESAKDGVFKQSAIFDFFVPGKIF